eukprot:8952723-Pyramimonas_sp.AAC.1
MGPNQPVGVADTIRCVDIPEQFFSEFTHAIQRQLWFAASSHFDGAGMEQGIHNASYRQLLCQLEAAPGGRRLAGL